MSVELLCRVGQHGAEVVAVKSDFVGVVADSATAKAFLARYLRVAAPPAARLVRCAEVHIFHLAVALADEVAEQQVEGARLASLGRGRYVLHVCHLARLVDDTAGHYLCTVAYEEQFYLAWETLHQHLHFLATVGRWHSATRLVRLQQLPVFLQALPVALGHAVDIESRIDGTPCLTQVNRRHPQLVS